MKKLKVLIASMLGAIALVFACVIGTKVNAATTVAKTTTLNTVTVGEKYILNSSTVIAANSTINGNTDISGYYDIFSLTGSKWITKGTNSDKLCSNGDGSTDAQKCIIKVSLGSNQKIDWEMSAIASGDSVNASKIVVNNVAQDSSVTLNKLGDGTDLSGSYTNGTSNSIDFVFYFKGKAGFNSISVTVSNSTISLSSIAISGNSTTADVGDAIPTTSDMTVTATYSDNSNANVTTASTITVKNKSTDEIVTGTYPSAGTYTVTASYTFGGDTETASYDVTVNAATLYTITYYEVDGTTTKQVTVKQGEDFEVTLFKGGYEFLGWSTTQGNATADFTTTNIQASATIYPVFSSSPVTLLVVNKTYTLDVANSGITSTVYQSNSSDNRYFIDNAEAGKGVKKDGSNFSFANSPSGDKNYLGIIIPAKSYVIISLEALKGNASKSAKIDFAAVLNTSADNVTTGELTTTKTAYSVIYYNDSDDFATVKMFRNGGTTVTVSSLTVAVYSSVTAVNEGQSRGTGTAIRFAATLSNVGSLDVVTKWNYTLSMDGKTDVVGADKTTLYTSISGTNGKAAADNTYYVVLTVKNIPSSFNGKVLKCKFTITLSDGSTIDTDVVSETISITA